MPKRNTIKQLALASTQAVALTSLLTSGGCAPSVSTPNNKPTKAAHASIGGVTSSSTTRAAGVSGPGATCDLNCRYTKDCPQKTQHVCATYDASCQPVTTRCI